MTKPIRKGSGGGSSTPSIVPISFRTGDTMEINLAISEGPIGGLIRGPRSFYLGDTPLVAPNGGNNFDPFELHVYHGGDDATPVRNTLGGITSNSVVSVNLVQDTPVVRTTPSGARGVIDTLEIRLLIQNLARQTSKGDVKFNTLELVIEYRELGTQTWEYFLPDTPVYEFTGRVQGAVKELARRVPRIDNDWEIRITKLNPDDDEKNIAEVQWESFQSTTAEDKAYDNLALVRGISEASDQLNGVPQFWGVYAGLLVSIPSNYNPVSRHYDGVWDGTFKLGHTDNPAWCAYALGMNPRFGAKAYFPDLQMDRFSFYEAAQWCDEMVPRPGGGFQPRYTYNDLIQESRQGPQALQYILSIFGGVLVEDSGGTLVCKVDRPGTPVQVFGVESIREDGFNYQYTDVSTRPNSLNVSFINPNLNWETDLRELSIQSMIDRNGRNFEEFVAVGCVDLYEAQRRGQMRLIQANTETITVAFNTARQGLMLEPFDIIGISDTSMGWGLTGRIKSVSGNTITLRDPLTVPSLVDLPMSVQSPTGVHSLVVRSQTEYSTELIIQSGSLPADLPTRAQFALEESSMGMVKPFRVLSITEDDSDPDFVQILALELNTQKYDDADNMTFTETEEVVPLPSLPQRYSRIQASSGTEHLVRHGDGTIESRILVSWEQEKPGQTTLLYRRLDQDEFQRMAVHKSQALIPKAQDGTTYVMQLLGEGNPGVKSDLFTHTVVGKNEIPTPPTGWVATEGLDTVTLSGDTHPDVDFKAFKIYGATSEDDTLVYLDQVSTTRYVRKPPIDDPYTRYKVSAIDTTGNESDLTGFLEVNPTGIRVSDLPQDTRDKLDEAFERHDDVLADATGTIADLRDGILENIGALPGISLDPLDPLDPLTPPVRLSERIDWEIDRLNFEIPRITNTDKNIDDALERMIELQAKQFATDQTLAGAGIFVDEDTGKVRITAFESAEHRVSNVELNLSAVEAEIGLKASVSYVNKVVSETVLDPTQIPVVNDLEARVTDAEIIINAETGRIDSLVNNFEVDGSTVTMTEVSSSLDGLQGQITDRVKTTDFDDAVERVTAAEQTLTAFGDAAAITDTVEASRRAFDDIIDLTDKSIADLWERWKADEDFKEASAQGRRELRATVDDLFTAEASERLQLRAETETGLALLKQEMTVRVSETESLSQSLTQVSATLESTKEDVVGNAEATNVLTSRVEETEDGIVAEASERTLLEAGVTADSKSFEDALEEQFSRSLGELWNKWSSDQSTVEGVSVALREMDTRVVEGLSAEANERFLLGSALDQAKASISEERRTRTTETEALAEKTEQLEASITDPDGNGLLARVISAEGALVNEEGVRAFAAEEIVGSLEPQGGIGSALEANISKLANLEIDPNSALATFQQDVKASLDDGTGNFLAAEVISNTIAEVQDTENGLSATASKVDQIRLDLDNETDGVFAQITQVKELTFSENEIIGIAGTAINASLEPEGELDVALDGVVQRVANLEIDPNSILAGFKDEASVALDDGVGNIFSAGVLSAAVSKVENQEGELSALAGRADLLEVSRGEGNLVPNGRVQTGDFSGWKAVSSTFSIGIRGVGPPRMNESPTPFAVKMGSHPTEARGAIAGAASVSEGDILWISVKVTKVDGATGGALVRLRFFDAEENSIGVEDLGINETTTWARYKSSPRTAPAGAARMNISLLRSPGGSGDFFATDLRVERGLQAEESLAARVETIEGAYVDEEQAYAFVNQQVTAEYPGGFTSIAEDTAFAKATADGIKSGYVWRLNNSDVMEMVSVQDGVDEGITSTFKLDADYVQITGIAQIDNAVMAELAAENAFINNLEVGTLNIAENAVVVPSHAQFGTVTQVTTETTWTTGIAYINITRTSGIPTQIEFGGQLDGVGPLNSSGDTDGGAAIRFRVLRNGVVIGENLAHTSGYRGSRNSFSFTIQDNNTDSGNAYYAIQAQRVLGTWTGRVPQVISPWIRATQYKR